MRVILVPVSDRPECAVALRTAFNLGKQLGSSIMGCHIRVHSDSDVALPHDISPLMDEDYDPSWEVILEEKNIKDSGIGARALFGKLAEHRGYEFIKKPKSTAGAMWLERVGSPDRIFSIMGPVSDLIVVSRPAKKGKTLARRFMTTALLNSSKPVLILPQSQVPSIGKKISIAWNQSSEAARAVAAAMPLLCQADEVNIITNDSESKVGPKSKHLERYLRFWGIKSNRLVVKGKNDAKALLKGFEDSESDLMVMGGYSRSRFRQRIFGGVTEFMLHDANIPVFMLHS